MRYSALLVLCLAPHALAQSCTDAFQSDTGFIGANEPAPIGRAPLVRCGITWDPDGPGPQLTNLVVGGYIGGVDGVASRCIARWDGSQWLPMPGLGLSSATDGITALALHNGELYAAGRFSLNNDAVNSRVVRWDGAAWVQVAAVLNGPVNAMTSFAGELWIGGSFTAVGGRDFAHPVGDSWQGFALGSSLAGAPNSAVASMTIHQGELVVGGSFPGRVMRWLGAAPNGTFGATLSCPVSCSGAVQRLYSDGTSLYAAGSFRLWPSNQQPGVMKWDGAVWNTLQLTGNGAPAATAITTWNGDLIMTDGDGASGPSRLLRWNGSQWIEFGPADWATAGVASVAILAEYDGRLILGGSFTEVLDSGDSTSMRPLRGLAQWDGVRATAISRGVDARVTAMLDWGNGQTLAIGRFRAAGNAPADRIAIYDAQGVWRPFGNNQGFNADAWCAGMFQGRPIVGGAFTSAGGTPVSRIARWDGSAWQPFGATTDFPIEFAVTSSQLLMASVSSEGSAAPYARITRWNGSAWTPISGTTGTSHLRALGEDIFVNSPASLSPRPVLRWNGAAFEPLPLPPGETTLLLLGTRAGTLYASGLGGLYRWSGAAFEPAGDAPNVSGGTLGSRTADDGVLLHVPVNTSSWEQVYSWDGASWSTTGSMPLTPFYSTLLATISLRPPSLFSRGPDLLVGGAFQYLNSSRSIPGSFFARQRTQSRPITTSAPVRFLQRDAGESFSLSWSLDGPVTSRRWYRDHIQLTDGDVPGIGTVSGSATDTLSITNLDTRAGGAYTCSAFTPCHSLNLQATTVVVACNADLNADGSVDQDDIAYLIGVAASGDNPSTRNPDFNHDGNVDQDDVRALLDVVAGADCP